jgi:hypothetical protein
VQRAHVSRAKTADSVDEMTRVHAHAHGLRAAAQRHEKTTSARNASRTTGIRYSSSKATRITSHRIRSPSVGSNLTRTKPFRFPDASKRWPVRPRLWRNCVRAPPSQVAKECIGQQGATWERVASGRAPGAGA